MKAKHVFIIFIGIALVQLFVPFKMIWDKQSILDEGREFKLKTQPVDPYDPFRGKYITLNFEESSFKTKDSTLIMGQDVYVELEHDSLGFAKIKSVQKQLDDITDSHIKAKVSWYNASTETLNISYDFNRYYMDEYKAYDAELAYDNLARDTIVNNEVYAVIRVKEGHVVLKDVMIDNMSIKDYVAK